MTFNEITFIERRGSNSIKWDFPSKHPDTIFMWVADTDMEVPRPVMEAIRKRAEYPVFGYTMMKPDMGESVKSWCKRRFDWEVDLDWISFSTGVCPSLAIALRALGHPGDNVVLLSPVYYPMTSIPEANGFHVLRSPLSFSKETDQWEVDWADLEAKLALPSTTQFILCNPHNPCGRKWTRSELERMGQLCVKHSVNILSDEIHWDFVLPELDSEGKIVPSTTKHVPIASVSDEIADITVTLSAPSKTFNIPALQLSYMIVKNKRMNEALRREKDRLSAGYVQSIFAFEALPVAYNECEGWVDAINEHYARMAAKVRSFFSNPKYSSLVYVPKHESTFLMFIDLNGAIEHLKYVDSEGKTVYPLPLNVDRRTGEWVPEVADPSHPNLLTDAITQRCGVVLHEGCLFGKEGDGWVRINIAAKPETVDEALRRMGVMFDELLEEKAKREKA
ncbi:putative Cystathionine beta-lyase PatB [Blattamonas nauphoetae]|uniref:cysteine-S-conjugate beta-lyase n=1 Tax=Blattamonas nauphoetae TaxID=2049346 RepID=A0ABQ9Y783_9EUKA|nr:putative Cystathionine beta-lyase PatB [Blattamonas nauphoetae]